MSKMILIIEDERSIQNVIKAFLEDAGYTVILAGDGLEGVEQFRLHKPDLVLLDLMLPKIDGFAVCEILRKESRVPIIMLTALDDDDSQLKGFDALADDYITKPFSMPVVMKRIEAVLRRGALPEESPRKRLVYDKLIIDLDSFELVVDGKKVDTPPKEMELLYHLAASPNRVYTRNQLLDEVWGFDYFGDSRTVDVHIKRLREKLEGVSDQWSLKTVWGVGYKFEANTP